MKMSPKSPTEIPAVLETLDGFECLLLLHLLHLPGLFHLAPLLHLPLLPVQEIGLVHGSLLVHRLLGLAGRCGVRRHDFGEVVGRSRWKYEE